MPKEERDIIFFHGVHCGGETPKGGAPTVVKYLGFRTDPYFPELPAEGYTRPEISYKKGITLEGVFEDHVLKKLPADFPYGISAKTIRPDMRPFFEGPQRDIVLGTQFQEIEHGMNEFGYYVMKNAIPKHVCEEGSRQALQLFRYYFFTDRDGVDQAVLDRLWALSDVDLLHNMYTDKEIEPLRYFQSTRSREPLIGKNYQGRKGSCTKQSAMVTLFGALPDVDAHAAAAVNARYQTAYVWPERFGIRAEKDAPLKTHKDRKVLPLVGQKRKAEPETAPEIEPEQVPNKVPKTEEAPLTTHNEGKTSDAVEIEPAAAKTEPEFQPKMPKTENVTPIEAIMLDDDDKTNDPCYANNEGIDVSVED